MRVSRFLGRNRRWRVLPSNPSGSAVVGSRRLAGQRDDPAENLCGVLADDGFKSRKYVGLSLAGVAHRGFVGGPHFVWVLPCKTAQWFTRTHQLDAVLGHPLAREVTGVVGQENVGIGGDRSGKDVSILRVHLDRRERIKVLGLTSTSAYSM
jgi:hypothetical protein